MVYQNLHENNNTQKGTSQVLNFCHYRGSINIGVMTFGSDFINLREIFFTNNVFSLKLSLCIGQPNRTQI